MYLRLVEAEILRAGDGGLGRRGQVLPRLAPGLYLRVDALQHLHFICTKSLMASMDSLPFVCIISGENPLWYQPCQARLTP